MSRQQIVTHYLSAQDAAEIIQRQGLAQSLAGMARCITEDFKRWGDFDKSARVANHSKDGVIELMPIADARTYTFKYVNGHPKNTRQGLPTVMAFGVLADVDTGVPELVSELTLTTALRTAAMSAVAAKLAGNLSSTGLRAVVCTTVDQALQGADIVTTVTADKTNATILHAHQLKPGMHINAVGGDCPGKTELAADLLKAASVFVEYEPQTRIEGDLQQMPTDFEVTELWRVLRGEAEGRTEPHQITVFDSVGFALEDFSALRFMRDCARALGMSQTLSLIPELDNPKNLYAMIKPAAVATAPAAPATQGVEAVSAA